MLSINALDLFQDSNRMKTVSLGCPILNEITGGVSTFGITEISGEAGSGKTQLCLVLALQCVLQGFAEGTNDNTAYISCGEGSFPLKRFVQLCDHYSTPPSSIPVDESIMNNSSPKQVNTIITRNHLLEKVHIEMCRTMEDAFETIDKVIPAMCCQKSDDNNGKIRLVIIDSLAGIVRTDYDTKTSQDMLKRTAMLFRFAAKLKWLADTYRLCVVVVNQVSASGFESDGYNNNTNNSFGNNSQSEPVPALGLAWTHCVNTRWQLFRDTTCLRSSSICSSSSFTVDQQQQVHFDALTCIQQQQQTYGSNSNSTDNCFNNENKRPLCNSNSTDNINNNNIVSQQQYQQLDAYSKPTTISANSSNSNNSSNPSSRSRRYLRVILSPSQPPLSCEYIITSQGVFGSSSSSSSSPFS